LKECLIYFNENYKPLPELESFKIYNDFYRTETIKLPLSISEAFKNYSYEDFKDLLLAIGIKDIRNAYISFKRPPLRRKKSKLNKEEYRLLQRTLNWFNGKVTKIPKEVQENIVKKHIKRLGYNDYLKLFEKEANKPEVNAIEFLLKVLPGAEKSNL